MSARTGLVTERQRRHVTVEPTDGGAPVVCKSARRAVRPLVGDRVRWRPEHDGTGIVEAVLDRDTLLTRIDNRGRPEPVAANLTQLLVVAASTPAPDWSLVDRYLAAAELLGISALVVFNKVDLCDALPVELDTYRALAYTVCQTSAKMADGLPPLQAAMLGERSVMVGQSGVGKSSLINALLGNARQSVGALTGKGEQGRHTTTTTTLHRLDSGAELIDSPGVRQYSPHIEDERELANGFRELRALLGQCRFDDCQHLVEPDCAVKRALAERRIDARRYASYETLHATLAALRQRTR